MKKIDALEAETRFVVMVMAELDSRGPAIDAPNRARTLMDESDEIFDAAERRIRARVMDKFKKLV